MLERIFRLKENGTTPGRELLAGLTTFMTMAYIIVVNPAILQEAGFPREASMVATILSAAFGTLLMAFYANRPFAIAPYMGENAFVAYTAVKVVGCTWEVALGIIFWSGVLSTLITVTKLRPWMVKAIPQSIKYAMAVGIGLFLAFIGFVKSGIVQVGNAIVPVKLGPIGTPTVLLAVFGFLLTGLLVIVRFRAAIVTGILATTLVAVLLKVLFKVDIPGLVVSGDKVSLPPSLAPLFGKLKIFGVFHWSLLSVMLTMFLMDFLDMMGTLIGCSARAGFLDEKGDLPQVEKPMLADSLSTVAGAVLGTTTTGTYIESAAGIDVGGRTGMTALVVALLFLLALFFSPFLTTIPAFAYSPALIIVGVFMISPITKIDFSDYSELLPAFAVIALMSFTYNIGIGLIVGFVIYPLAKIAAGKFREIHPGAWIFFLLSVLYFVFAPQ